MLKKSTPNIPGHNVIIVITYRKEQQLQNQAPIVRVVIVISQSHIAQRRVLYISYPLAPPIANCDGS